MALSQEIQKAINRRNYGILEQLRLEAFESRDAGVFYVLCNETGFIPSRRDEADEERELYERGFIEATEAGVQKAPRKSKKLELCLELVRRAESLPYTPEATFMDTAEKTRILRNVLGYTTLKTRDGEMPLDECNDARIGRAFTNSYRTAKNFIRTHDSQASERAGER